MQEYKITEADFNAGGDVRLTFSGLRVVNMKTVKLIEGAPTMLKALTAADFYFNASDKQILESGRDRESYLQEFNVLFAEINQ